MRFFFILLLRKFAQKTIKIEQRLILKTVKKYVNFKLALNLGINIFSRNIIY